ncbi:o-succinylbenzoate synthase [Candidatus Enterococcus mangumiae]|uniref:o-succinylbenzoate synthase n=1 Tax=Candidatus Enterococcus mangumiae TaxID=2230878 RepID=UPI001A8CD5A4|nr:o-succinylbenzoate synthase [Enterococcus sp. DIV1094]
MKIVNIHQYCLRLPLVTPFKTSYGQLETKAFDLLILEDELGNQGIGELVSFERADYIEETIDMSRSVIQNELIPRLFDLEFSHPAEIWSAFKHTQGNFMAKSAVETAVWDLYARRLNVPLQKIFSAERSSIPVGVSIGVHENVGDLLATAKSYVEQGYQRIKLKITPGNDLVPLQALRKEYPEIQLMADANSAYTLRDLPLFKQMDTLALAMIEQPFHPRDYVDHAMLQKQIKTAVCLDENIRTLEDVRTAHALGSCRAINLKIPRVGGITEALKIVEFCQKNELLVWLGGMFESGVGRALNLHFASQDCFTFPGDLSAFDRYFHDDIVEPKATINNGQLAVPDQPGIGVIWQEEQLLNYSYDKKTYVKK